MKHAAKSAKDILTNASRPFTTGELWLAWDLLSLFALACLWSFWPLPWLGPVGLVAVFVLFASIAWTIYCFDHIQFERYFFAHLTAYSAKLESELPKVLLSISTQAPKAYTLIPTDRSNAKDDATAAILPLPVGTRGSVQVVWNSGKTNPPYTVSLVEGDPAEIILKGIRYRWMPVPRTKRGKRVENVFAPQRLLEFETVFELLSNVFPYALERCAEEMFNSPARFGSYPNWLQGAEHPKCPDCKTKPRHILQLSSLSFHNRDFEIYVFQCDRHPLTLIPVFQCT